MPRYQRIIGKWFNPGSTFVMKCCDCDLVHTVDFKLDGKGVLQMRATADEKETARLRAKNKIAIWRI